MAVDTGRLAPAGTALDLQNVFHDGVHEWRSGGAITSDAGSTVTHNGTVTINGAATLPGVTSIGPATTNDLTESVAPSSAGLIAWNFPYAQATGTGSAVLTGGSLYLAKIPLAAGTVVTNLWFSIATAAATTTSGQNFGGLYSSAGALLAQTADLATTIGTNTGTIQAPLTAAYTISASGNYYIGFSLNASTLPVLTCYVAQVTVTTSVVFFGSTTKFGNTAAKYPFAINTTGNTTTIPASLTMSSNTATGAFAYWTAVN